ncbi:MAG: hypothetical protein JO041_08570 [Acidobacteria bacterium]|nr:hypothetical protein [Acidobacteriota bacterium]
MRFASLLAIVLPVVAGAALTGAAGSGRAQPVLLAQSQGGPAALQAAPGQAPAPAPNNKSSDRNSSGNQAEQPGSAPPWLGAPPQFKPTWPPTVLPQTDGDDDLLLMQAAPKPPKIHKA